MYAACAVTRITKDYDTLGWLHSGNRILQKQPARFRVFEDISRLNSFNFCTKRERSWFHSSFFASSRYTVFRGSWKMKMKMKNEGWKNEERNMKMKTKRKDIDREVWRSQQSTENFGWQSEVATISVHMGICYPSVHSSPDSILSLSCHPVFQDCSCKDVDRRLDSS